MICVFIRGETQREEGSHIKMAAEMGVTPPQTKEHLGPSEAGRGKEAPLPGCMNLPTL